MSGIHYPITDLVTYLNQMTLSNIVSVDSLKNPDPVHVQTLYFLLLKEIGFSGLDRVPEQCHLDKITKVPAEAELLKDSIMTDSLSVACRYFFSKVGGSEIDIKFGLLDLVDPKSDRLRKFLSVIVNFYLFCTNNYEEVERIKTESQAKVHRQQNLEAGISKCISDIQTLRLTKAEEETKAAKMSHDLNQMHTEMEQLLIRGQDIQDQCQFYKSKLCEMSEHEESLAKCIQQLEKEEARLKSISKLEDKKVELEVELQKPIGEYESVLDRQEILEKEIVNFEQKEKDLEKLFKLMANLKVVRSKVQTLANEVASKQADLEAASKILTDHDSELLRTSSKMSDLKSVMVSACSKWEKKKPAMKNHLEELRAQLEKINQQMSEEDLISEDLAERIKTTKDSVVNERRYLSDERRKVKEMFCQMKIALENLISKKSEIEMAMQACKKLDAYRP